MAGAILIIRVEGSTRVWFVTGASRGFGLEIAREAPAEGDAVVASARNAEQVEAELAGTGRLR
ncbi:hypothetical protein GCM10010140_68230 [Streptosporangium pseudovulgare]|uniref:Short-chain dehydrogenase n=1 Tax=Streptosporangium pseudovulgare TaxID=35765 RepID=A0ABQ2RER0_9ACTN|nr:hypothetical protein GCM10010140_68230 [Streptosporangium pseudovulgare]